MITKTSIYYAPGTNPETNLAVEEYLLFRTLPGECILYLWQNEHTVVVGRNQNCWKECRMSLLREEGGHLVRRLSGGGAVYHDLGNLNFTFLVRKQDYDLKRQLLVIQKAVESFGIAVEKSGRNDLLAEGRKFSGNAYYESGEAAYHHGTLLVDADLERMSRYLTVSKEKLRSKGVDSVRSRVGNLKDLNKDVTVERLKAALETAFGEVYGTVPETYCFGEADRTVPETYCFDEADRTVPETYCFGEADRTVPKTYSSGKKERQEIRCLEEKYASPEWKYGRRLAFTHQFSGRFDWGSVELELSVEQGRIREARLYTDALDTRLPESVRGLSGCIYERLAVKQRFEECGSFLAPVILKDLTGLLWEEL